MKVRQIILLFCVLDFMTGCVAVQSGIGFNEVEKIVSDRIDKKVHWNQGTKLDEQAEKEVKLMLEAELTADTAVQIGLLNNRGLQVHFEELNIAQADLVEAGLLKNPVFDAEARFAKGGRTTIELSVVQNFIDILLIPLRKRFASIGFEAAKLRASDAVLILAGEIRAGFYTLQGALQEYEMRKQVLASLDASYFFAKKLRAAGNITELELLGEQALYEQSRLDVISAEIEIIRSREELSAMMGVWGRDSTWTISPKLPEMPTEEVSAEGLESTAVKLSLELGVAKNELEQAAASLGMAGPLGIYSDAELGVSGEREPDGTSSIGPSFSLPIPLFNQGQPGIASAQANFRRAETRYFAKAVSLRSSVRSLYTQLGALKSQGSHYQSVLLPLRARMLDQMQLQYNAMQIGPVPLLQAKKEQIEVGSTYIKTLRDFWLVKTELDQLLAGGRRLKSKPTSNEVASY